MLEGEEPVSDRLENSMSTPYKLITRRIDSPKIRTSHKRDLIVHTSHTKDLKITREKNPIRSGAIIYTKCKTDQGPKTYFCLGIDTQSRNLTDFAGGVTKGETVIEGGLRELKEESQGVFGDIAEEDIKDTLLFHCHNMITMFIPRLDIDMNNACSEFRSKIEAVEEPEVCDIVWLETNDFLESIHGRGRKLYVRVRRLLTKVTSTIGDL